MGGGIFGPNGQESIAQGLYVFSASHTARRARPVGARELSPGFTLGKPR